MEQQTNRDYLIECIDRTIHELTKAKEMVKDDPAKTAELLGKACIIGKQALELGQSMQLIDDSL